MRDEILRGEIDRAKRKMSDVWGDRYGKLSVLNMALYHVFFVTDEDAFHCMRDIVWCPSSGMSVFKTS